MISVGTVSRLIAVPNRVEEIKIKSRPYYSIALRIGSNKETLNATSTMQSYCLNAPIISLSNSCDLHCNALNQTAYQCKHFAQGIRTK